MRGRGDVVVIRSESPAETRVSALRGWFRVKSPRGIGLPRRRPGRGDHRRRPRPRSWSCPPARPGSIPGTDRVYVEQGRAARLSWNGSAPRYRVQVLSLDGDEVVLSREVEGTSLEVPGRWLGTFRWRVSAVDARGVEGPPSAPGLFCVVEK